MKKIDEDGYSSYEFEANEDYNDFNEFMEFNAKQQKSSNSVRGFLKSISGKANRVNKNSSIEGVRGAGLRPVVFVIAGIVLLMVSGAVGYYLGSDSVFDDSYQQGYDQGNNAGYDDGFAQGQSDGYDVGYEEGYSDAGIEISAMDNSTTTDSSVTTDTSTAGVSSDDVVYITASGSCYHKSTCASVSGKSGLQTMSVSEAEAAGYKACSKCCK